MTTSATYAEEIKASLDRFCAAWQTNDGAAAGACFTEDGTLINPFGQRADGRDEAALIGSVTPDALTVYAASQR